MPKSDLEKDLDRLLDQVQGDTVTEERQARFRQARDEAIGAKVDVLSEVQQAQRAYRDFQKGKYQTPEGFNLKRGLVDAGVLCELDYITNFLVSATRRARGQSN
jgi:hypothetical protein